MSQCVPDWDWDRHRGSGCGDYSGHTGNDPPFAGTADDVWPWWDWDLDDVAELKWANGQPRVLLQTGTASKPPTPTSTGTAALTMTSQPTDKAGGAVEDFDLEPWLQCAAADEGCHHLQVAAAETSCDQAADAIVPGSTARQLPGAGDSASCLVVPVITTAPLEAVPAASCSLAAGRQERKRPRAAGQGEGQEQLGWVKRRRGQQREQQYHQEDSQLPCSREQGEGQRLPKHISARICSASANNARCRSAISERKRRDKFNQKIRTLQKLVPSCGKVDKVSILDEVIAHVRQLHEQVQMHMMSVVGSGAGLPVPPPPMMMPAPAATTPMAAYMQQQFQIMAQMATQMSHMFGMGLAGANGGIFPHPPSPLMNFSSLTLTPTTTGVLEQQLMTRNGSGSSTREGFGASFAELGGK